MGYLELYDRNTCIQYCQQYLYKQKCTSIIIKLNSDYEFFSVLLWSFNEIVFLFKES